MKEFLEYEMFYSYMIAVRVVTQHTPLPKFIKLYTEIDELHCMYNMSQ